MSRFVFDTNVMVSALLLNDSVPGQQGKFSTTTLPGYRQSEIGLLPDDWEITTLGALGRLLSGGTPRTSESRYWNGDIPWVSSKDMKLPRLDDSIDHVTPLALGNGTRLVQPGTILMVVRGMSLVHSFPVAIVDKPVAFNQDLKAFVPNAGVDSEAAGPPVPARVRDRREPLLRGPALPPGRRRAPRRPGRPAAQQYEDGVAGPAGSGSGRARSPAPPVVPRPAPRASPPRFSRSGSPRSAGGWRRSASGR